MNILDAFHDYGIKQTGNNKYLCRCPSHDDKSPSLTITELPDKILVHSFAGCDAESIMSAVGLTVNDLFADDGKEYKKEKSLRFQRERFMSDYRLVKLGESDIKRGKEFSLDDKRVFKNAINRINQYKFNADKVYFGLIKQDRASAKLDNAFLEWKFNGNKYHD